MLTGMLRGAGARSRPSWNDVTVPGCSDRAIGLPLPCRAAILLLAAAMAPSACARCAGVRALASAACACTPRCLTVLRSSPPVDPLILGLGWHGSGSFEQAEITTPSI